MSCNAVEFELSVTTWEESTTEVGGVISVFATILDEIVDKGTISDAEIAASSGTNEYNGLGAAIETNDYYSY